MTAAAALTCGQLLSNDAGRGGTARGEQQGERWEG